MATEKKKTLLVTILPKFNEVEVPFRLDMMERTYKCNVPHEFHEEDKEWLDVIKTSGYKYTITEK